MQNQIQSPTQPSAQSKATSLKTLPAGMLQPVAFVFIVGEYENEETGSTSPETEYEVYDQAAFDSVSIPSRAVCNCCGHALKYICVFKHSETQEIFFVGRDCAAKIERLKFSPMVAGGEGMGIALAERAACNGREKAFIAEHPEAIAAVEWAKTGINSAAQDMVAKIRRFGNPSEKQIAFLIKRHADDTDRRASAAATAPNGRQTVKGTILSAKLVENDFGKTAKLLVDIGGGVKVYGNGGSACMDYDRLTVEKGDEIEFTATFEPSQKDTLFGFFKRPSKVTCKKLQSA